VHRSIEEGMKAEQAISPQLVWRVTHAGRVFAPARGNFSCNSEQSRQVRQRARAPEMMLTSGDGAIFLAEEIFAQVVPSSLPLSLPFSLRRAHFV
jgi:hypothetical protein